jgi:pyruvate,water dikinase
MGVLIMEMIDAKTAGVLFTENPLTGKGEFVIEAVWGLGHGLVSGQLTPDLLVFNSQIELTQTQIADKPYQYKQTGRESQLAKVAVPFSEQSVPALPADQAASLCACAKTIADTYGAAQNIEWAVDSSGTLWILQSRNITSNTTPMLTFSPPGPGVWRIVDHIVRPGTRCFSQYYYESMEQGWNYEARLIGLPIRAKIREVNGFMYYQIVPVESSQAFLDACATAEGYWDEKRYLSALHFWDNSVKPSATNILVRLQNTRLDELSDKALLEHLVECFVTTRRMVKDHHRFTFTSLIPIGDLIRQVCRLIGLEPAEALMAIRGRRSSSFVSLNDAKIRALISALKSSTDALALLSTTSERYPRSADKIIDELSKIDTHIEQGLKYVLRRYGYRVIDGYDIAGDTFIERPDLILKSLKSVIDTSDTRAPRENQPGKLAISRDPMAEAKLPLLDEMLQDSYDIERLRDERGMYTDLWAVAILRHAILEAGKRLEKRALLDTHHLALDASQQELADLLKGTQTVTSRELRRRAMYRSSHTVADAPATLGEPTTGEPVTVPDVTPSLARTMGALTTAIALAVERPPADDIAARASSEEQACAGVPASPGIVEGRARVIASDVELRDIIQGDILVVRQATAALDLVFPIIGGIISQFGGVLSHPAILAREYRVPCVVGCSDVMDSIRTGMKIRLDGTTGEVTILSTDDDALRRVSLLVNEYAGPMQGRNRLKVLNHAGAVSDRLRIVNDIRANRYILDILNKHYNEAMTSHEALQGIVRHQQFSEELLMNWIRRQHVELHVCDRCNLGCYGCTYFQDTPSRPDPRSFPFDQISKICSMIGPTAVTLVGGGEPALYRSGDKRLGDLISALGSGYFGSEVKIGLITNGSVWPPGDPSWHEHVQWIRFSLDASSPEVYRRYKGKDHFWRVVNNIMLALTSTAIPQVGVGFVYNADNIGEAASLIPLFATRVRELCPDQIDRFNIQFRPWRPPVGNPSIRSHVLSQIDAERAAATLLNYAEKDGYFERFVRRNTNIAVNLLCRGARDAVTPFSECLFSLAKTVVRADGSLYPCFRMAAQEDRSFYFGNILRDSPLKIALRELYVATSITQQVCVPEYERCLFCVFNNILETGVRCKFELPPELVDDFFF